MSNRDSLRKILTALAGEGAPGIDNALNQIIDEFPELEDHAGQRGYWTTSDEYGNLDGEYATREEAIENGPGQYAQWVDEDEEYDEIEIPNR